MTLSVTFYDNIKYHRQDFIARDSDFFGNGVVNLPDFPLTYPATPNMTVNVGPGTAWVDGYRVTNDSNIVQLTIPAADATNPRIDIIQIGHDDLNSQPSLMVKKGVAAASPVEPGADQNYIKLFAINVAANATSISSANVTDRRVLVPLKVSGSQIQTSGLLSNDPGAVTDTNIGNRTADPTLVPSPPAGSTTLTGKLTDWLSWFANRIKAMTGKTNWYDAPRTTLENAVKRDGDTMTGDLTLPGIHVTGTRIYTPTVDGAGNFFFQYNGETDNILGWHRNGLADYKPTVMNGGQVRDIATVLSGGYKIQSGEAGSQPAANTVATFNITFPVAFTDIPRVMLTLDATNPQAYALAATNRTKTGFTLQLFWNGTASSFLTVIWEAIGS